MKQESLPSSDTTNRSCTMVMLYTPDDGSFPCIICDPFLNEACRNPTGPPPENQTVCTHTDGTNERWNKWVQEQTLTHIHCPIVFFHTHTRTHTQSMTTRPGIPLWNEQVCKPSQVVCVSMVNMFLFCFLLVNWVNCLCAEKLSFFLGYLDVRFVLFLGMLHIWLVGSVLWQRKTICCLGSVHFQNFNQDFPAEDWFGSAKARQCNLSHLSGTTGQTLLDLPLISTSWGSLQMAWNFNQFKLGLNCLKTSSSSKRLKQHLFSPSFCECTTSHTGQAFQRSLQSQRWVWHKKNELASFQFTIFCISGMVLFVVTERDSKSETQKNPDSVTPGWQTVCAHKTLVIICKI